MSSLVVPLQLVQLQSAICKGSHQWREVLWGVSEWYKRKRRSFDYTITYLVRIVLNRAYSHGLIPKLPNLQYAFVEGKALEQYFFNLS